MKIKIAVLAIILCVTSSSSVFARDYYNGYRGGDRSYGYHGGGHYRDGFGIAAGVVGGLILGTALISAAAPPPPPVVYEYPRVTYQQPVVVRRPRVCVEERVVNGEWQTSRYDGRQVWVSYSYPVTQTVQVPCY